MVQWLTRRQAALQEDSEKTPDTEDDEKRGVPLQWLTRRSLKSSDGADKPWSVGSQLETQSSDSESFTEESEGVEDDIKGSGVNKHQQSGNGGGIDASKMNFEEADGQAECALTERARIKRNIKRFFESSASQKAATITAHIVYVLATVLKSRSVRRNVAYCLRFLSQVLQEETTQWLVCTTIEVTAKTVNNDHLLDPVSQSLSILAESVLEFSGVEYDDAMLRDGEKEGTINSSSAESTLSSASKAFVQLLGDVTVWASVAVRDERVLEALTTIAFFSQKGWHSPNTAWALSKTQSALMSSTPAIKKLLKAGKRASKAISTSPTVSNSKDSIVTAAKRLSGSEVFINAKQQSRKVVRMVLESERTKVVAKTMVYGLLYLIWLLCVGLGTLVIYAEKGTQGRRREVVVLEEEQITDQKDDLISTDDTSEVKALEYLLRTNKKAREEFIRLHLRSRKTAEYPASLLLQIGDLGSSSIVA